jgi:hypothetical protein
VIERERGQLEALLSECSFDERTDRLILVGDLVNKGPYSAETCRSRRRTTVAAVRTPLHVCARSLTHPVPAA